MRRLCIMFASMVLCAGFAAGETTAPATKNTGNSVVPPPRINVEGQRFSASLGNLYIPPFFDAGATTRTDVVVFFHGATWCAEQNFFDARKNAVLITINLSDYAPVFRDPDMLNQVLRAAREQMVQEDISRAPIGRICLASFSGGYSAVREILALAEFQEKVTDVVLADSLYPKKNSGKVDAESIKPFLDFAKRAAAGEKTFLFSHLFPPEERYRSNTTTLAANYLIAQAGAQRQQTTERTSRGTRILYRADKNGFHVLGYAGMTNQDHFEHFYGISDLLKRISFEDAR